VHKRLLALIPIALLAACADGSPVGALETDPTLVREAQSVTQSLDQIGTMFEGVESDDLAMAWTDLDADLRSVVEDLVRDPGSVDVDGMQARVEGFITRFRSEEAMVAINGDWENLIDGLDQLASRPRQIDSS
jgi:hypothetical protein